MVQLRIIILFTILLITTRAFAGRPVPDTPGSVPIEGETTLHLFIKNNNRLSFMNEIKGRIEGTKSEFRYRSLTLGPYFRILKNLKLGAFYRMQRGARHDDDWIWDKGHWRWENSDSRNEHVLIGDISPRFLLPQLPGKNWLFELKNRYLYNTYNNNQTVTVRPGLTYFLMEGLDPLINFALQYELYIPINYGNTIIYEQWIYANILYHMNRDLTLGLYSAYKKITWGTSGDFENRFPGETYRVDYSAFVIGISANYTIHLQ